MIKIVQGPAPAALNTADIRAARQRLRRRYDTAPAACRAPNSERLHVPATLYNAPAIKAQLIAVQHEKCCYCEANLLHVGYGDVEHYRPKNGFRQARGAKLEKPGYYWLAYTWRNLLFSCKRCNGGHKRNYFPLANSATGRARSHHDSLRQEQPLLLHPASDDPADHIDFQQAVVIAKTPRGQATIDLCGLNRKFTLERRRTHLAHLESHDSMADMNPATMSPTDLAREVAKCGSVPALVKRILQARTIRNAAALDTAEFAGMVRANFPHLPTV